MAKAKLLVCINDNDHSRVALHFACRKATHTGCPVEILHVIEPNEYQNFFSVADVIQKEQRAEAEQLLRRFAEEAYNYAGITPSLMLKEGMLGEEIVAAIEEDHSINMLLLGTSPDSPSRGTLLPWLASQLGRTLQIPMMIIPGNLTEQQIRELT